MKKDLVEGLTVDLKTTTGRWLSRAGKILRYDCEGFYRVKTQTSPDFVVHEDEIRPSIPITIDRHPTRRE
jgi:hypothetical protein